MIAELSRAEIDALLREQVVGRIGCHLDGLTYVVPVIYAYDGECVHVATVEGQKVRMMRANPSVCFEVDHYAGPGRWRSAILQGTYEEAAGDEQEATLAVLKERFAQPGASATRRPEPRDGRTVCFRIRVREATGRFVDR